MKITLKDFRNFWMTPTTIFEIDDDWREFLMRLDFRGKQPSSKREWVELHLSLRRIFPPKAK